MDTMSKRVYVGTSKTPLRRQADAGLSSPISLTTRIISKDVQGHVGAPRTVEQDKDFCRIARGREVFIHARPSVHLPAQEEALQRECSLPSGKSSGRLLTRLAIMQSSGLHKPPHLAVDLQWASHFD